MYLIKIIRNFFKIKRKGYIIFIYRKKTISTIVNYNDIVLNKRVYCRDTIL